MLVDIKSDTPYLRQLSRSPSPLTLSGGDALTFVSVIRSAKESLDANMSGTTGERDFMARAPRRRPGGSYLPTSLASSPGSCGRPRCLAAASSTARASTAQSYLVAHRSFGGKIRGQLVCDLDSFGVGSDEMCHWSRIDFRCGFRAGDGFVLAYHGRAPQSSSRGN